MKQFIQSKKGLALLATLVVAAVAAVGGFAYFTTTGSGNGSASVGTDSAITLHATTAGNLYPGGPAQTVSFTADNPSPGHEYVGTIHLVSVDTPAGCSAADFTMPDVAANQDIASGNGQAITATGLLSMANNGNQDLCKNASLTLHLTSN